MYWEVSRIYVHGAYFFTTDQGGTKNFLACGGAGKVFTLSKGGAGIFASHITNIFPKGLNTLFCMF